MSDHPSDASETEFRDKVKKHAYDAASDFFDPVQSDWDVTETTSERVEFYYDFASDPKCPHAHEFFACVVYFFDSLLEKSAHLTLSERLILQLKPGVQWDDLLEGNQDDPQNMIDDFFMDNDDREKTMQEKVARARQAVKEDLEVGTRLLQRMSKAQDPDLKLLFKKIVTEFKP